jgi:hypothetical protein
MMGVTPYTSPNDQHPFNPNATPSSGSSASIPASSSVPDLAMYWSAPPDLTPQASGGSSSGSSQSNPPIDSLTVNLGGIRDAEQTMLTSSSTIVSAYESLKSLYLSGQNTVFGQEATDTTGSNGGYSESSWTFTTSADPIAQPAQEFAEGSNGQPGMNAVQEYALQQVADAIAVVGEFIALLNAAAQQYSQADVSSFLPPPS